MSGDMTPEQKSDIAHAHHQLVAENVRLRQALVRLEADLKRMRNDVGREGQEVMQILAQAIGGYPWFKDDQKNFPDATEADGVCVGEHVPATLAMEAARVIKDLRSKVIDYDGT